jgi:hypothetical protein
MLDRNAEVVDDGEQRGVRSLTKTRIDLRSQCMLRRDVYIERLTS